MFIETDEGNFTNLDFVERVTIKADAKGNKIANLFDAEGNLISNKMIWNADALRHFESALGVTVVPVATGYTLVNLHIDDSGGDDRVHETPIIAFRAFNDTRMPEPVTLDGDVMMGRWGIRYLTGKVMEPSNGVHDSPAAFLESVRNEVAKEDRKAQRKIKAKAR